MLNLTVSKNRNNLVNRFTLLKGFESVKDNGNARQLEKLLWPMTRHPLA